ncbi:hypothetical protein [Rhizobium johnstonii]|uniref:hypothetical protein n=1 Tax=Rhizobium johnstonii TaxID=3019933 RepID=UPI003F9DAA85
MFQVSVLRREGEGILQPMHLKEHVEFAVFLIGGAARKRPLLAEDRHDRPLHRGHESAAIEEIGSLVKADKALRPIADQPVFGESCAVAPRESREQIEIEARKLRASSRSVPSSAETPAPSACEGENAASSAQSPTARSRLFIFVSSYGQLRLDLAAGGENFAPGHQPRRFLPASRGYEASKTRTGLIQREERRRSLALILMLPPL